MGVENPPGFIIFFVYFFAFISFTNKYMFLLK